MNYLMLVCSEDAPLPPDAQPIREGDIERWLELCGERRIFGDQLEEPAEAKTVRVRAGEILVSDGPFVEAKEFIGGFDLLECEDLDAAVELAAAHPVTRNRMVELRPFADGFSFAGTGQALESAAAAPGQLYALMICADGIPEADEVEAEIVAESKAWGDRLRAQGFLPFGMPLQQPEMATTVRVRSGTTLLSDGPFVETKEFLAGFCVLRCGDIDEAIELAAQQPLASWHRVEVRPFKEW